MLTPSEFMTVEEIAEYMRLPQSTVYKLARQGKLPGFKVGRHWRFRREAVIQWVYQQEQVATAPMTKHD